MGTVRAILGDKALSERSYMQAHGTGTPQNRVTESHIFDAMAKAFGIKIGLWQRSKPTLVTHSRVHQGIKLSLRLVFGRMG